MTPSQLSRPIRFGSVCSGIEAASVAWAPLGWEAAWFSEIEPFPCAVLAYRFPKVQNHGDMTTLPARILSGEIEAPDILCGGTPCRAFSVAGRRESLEHKDGRLALTFCAVANAIDAVRARAGLPPCIVFWENVPGALSTRDNAFGCLLAGIAGASLPYEIDSGKWGRAGVVFGRKRKIAWRVLDAQYFGTPQRRRRVFLVASAREGFNPAAVLFEPEGVFGDLCEGAETGETASGTVEDHTEICMANGAPVTDALTAHDLEQQITSQTGGGVLVPTGGYCGVRRLMPVECERLQGFPDGWTRIPYRGKPAEECPDSRRFRAIGNSWAVPVVRWIGERIQRSCHAASA